MTSFPLRCGRLDCHAGHEWRTPHATSPYFCTGHVLTEVQRTEHDAAAADPDTPASTESLADIALNTRCMDGREGLGGLL